MTEILDNEMANAGPESTGFEFYRDFFKAEHASSFVKMLKEHQIPYRLEKTQTLMTGTITGHGLVPFAVVKLQASDFGKVNGLLEQAVMLNPDAVADHYLQDFDAEELTDLVKNSDEWTPEDVAVAKHLLRQRGLAIPEERMIEFKQKRTAALLEGKDAAKGWLIFGYGAAVVGGLMLSPLLILAAVGTGLYLWQDKTVDSSGKKYFTFNIEGQRAGQVIFYLAVGCALLSLVALLVFQIEFPFI